MITINIIIIIIITFTVVAVMGVVVVVQVSDIKRALSGLCGIPPSALVFSMLQHNQ